MAGKFLDLSIIYGYVDTTTAEKCPSVSLKISRGLTVSNSGLSLAAVLSKYFVLLPISPLENVQTTR